MKMIQFVGHIRLYLYGQFIFLNQAPQHAQQLQRGQPGAPQTIILLNPARALNPSNHGGFIGIK